MSKKTLIIIVAAFVLIILLMLAGFFFFVGGPSGTDRDGGGIGDFFPFGRGDSTGDDRPLLPGEDTDTIVIEGDEPARKALQLQQLTTSSVAGAFATTSLQGNIVVQYIEDSTGNVFEINMLSLANKRLSNTTIPAVKQAYFDASGKRLLIRYLNENDVIKTFAGRILALGETIEEDEEVIESKVNTDEVENQPESNTEPQASSGNSGRIVGNFLEDDITFVSVSPDEKRIFYLMPIGTSVVGISSNFDDTEKEQLIDSPNTEWLPQWPREEVITLTTKASGGDDGFLYFLNVQTGELARVLGDILGLTTLTNTDTSIVLYSESTRDQFTLSAFNTTEHASLGLSISTLPEKCVWSSRETTVAYCGVPAGVPNDTYPDAWYQGKVLFSDTIWKINAMTNTPELLIIPTEIARQPLDVTQPFLSINEEYLFFINKWDSTLWSLKLQ